MIYTLTGKISDKTRQYAILETNGGIGFKIFITPKTYDELPAKNGGAVKFFCHTHVKQEGLELYGFLSEKELNFFEVLNSISGVGPKMALRILSVASIDDILTAIDKERTDILTRISGVGKKTAERVALELKDKIKHQESEHLVSLFEVDEDIFEALKNLGYKQSQIGPAIKNIPPEVKKPEDRLKHALKFLGKR